MDSNSRLHKLLKKLHSVDAWGWLIIEILTDCPYGLNILPFDFLVITDSLTMYQELLVDSNKCQFTLDSHLGMLQLIFHFS